jgi:hypothetical protein
LIDLISRLILFTSTRISELFSQFEDRLIIPNSRNMEAILSFGMGSYNIMKPKKLVAEILAISYRYYENDHTKCNKFEVEGNDGLLVSDIQLQ